MHFPSNVAKSYRAVFVVLAITAGIYGCQRPSTSLPPGAPAIAIVQPSRNLGLIKLGPHVETFEVSNSGGGELTITQLERSCACANVDTDRTVVPVGKTAHIK